MGKVLSDFNIGWPGAISRSIDDIVISLPNAGSVAIPYGVPVFLAADGEGVVLFDPDASPAQTFADFVGFTVRDASKTPSTYPAGQDMSPSSGNQAGEYGVGEKVDVLVRGSIAANLTAGFLATGGKVYLKKADGTLVAEAGAEGTTFELTNVKVKTPQQNYSTIAEIVITDRNIL